MKRVKIYTVSVLLLVTLLITLLSGCYSASSVMKRNPEAEEMGFSVISIEDWAKISIDDGSVTKEEASQAIKLQKHNKTKYAIQLERNQNNANYSDIYIKQIGKEDFYQEKGKHGATGSYWVSKEDELELKNRVISGYTRVVMTGSKLFRDIEIAFLTAEQATYIDSLECDDVAKWKEIEKISDKVIKWNIWYRISNEVEQSIKSAVFLCKNI